MLSRKQKKLEASIDAVMDELGDFYELLSGALESEINRTVDARLAFVVFFYGASLSAGLKHELDDRTATGVFPACLHILGMDKRECMILSQFAISVLSDADPWITMTDSGGRAYGAWNDGSETRAIAMLAEALRSAPQINPDSLAANPLAEEAAYILR